MNSSFRLPMLLIAALALASLPAIAQHATEPSAPAAAVVTAGEIEISGAFSRATLPNAPVAAAYFTLTNTGMADDRLLAASAPIAARSELHTMSLEGDVMKMSALPDGIPLPAGESVTLAPGGLHVMFMELAGPLAEGTVFPLTLTFETAGTVTVDVVVGSFGAGAPGHGDDHGAAAPAHGGNG